MVNLSQNLKIPIIAYGGVTKPEDAIKMIMAGASAVQIYSAVHMAGNQGVVFLDNFIKDFNAWINKYGYVNINSFKGILLPKLSRAHQMNINIPKCGACASVCPTKALK